MIKTIVVSLIMCVIEFLAIVSISPLAKPSLILRFLPADIRETAKDHPQPSAIKQFTAHVILVWLVMTSGFYKKLFPETKDCKGWKDRSWNNKNQIIRLIAFPFLCMLTSGIFMLFK